MPTIGHSQFLRAVSKLIGEYCRIYDTKDKVWRQVRKRRPGVVGGWESGSVRTILVIIERVLY
jgi:hypothetical protein